MGEPPTVTDPFVPPPKGQKMWPKSGLNCGHFLAKKWPKLWPILAKKWQIWQIFGKILAKIWQKSGKKWPILSRMGELLKGSFFGRFWAPPRGGLGGSKRG